LRPASQCGWGYEHAGTSTANTRFINSDQSNRLEFLLTQDSFQAGNPDIVVRVDGRSLVQLGHHPVLWTLPREERSPEVVDRIVRERVRWRVVNGRLLPVTATLHGRVLRHGQAVARAEITIMIERYGLFGLHATTDADGRFVLPSLPYGDYGVI